MDIKPTWSLLINLVIPLLNLGTNIFSRSLAFRLGREVEQNLDQFAFSVCGFGIMNTTTIRVSDLMFSSLRMSLKKFSYMWDKDTHFNIFLYFLSLSSFNHGRQILLQAGLKLFSVMMCAF